MALPLLPIAGAGALLLFLLSKKADAASKSPYDQSTPEGGPPKKEPAPPAKTWKEMPPALQEQVAAALGALGVSPTTGKIEGVPTANAIKLATQTAALCESQGFYEVAKELNRLIGEAAPKVATPPEAGGIKAAAPPGLSAEQIEAIARTLTLDRDPKSIAALIKSLEQLPPSRERDNYIQMAQALLLQLAAAQSTTQTMQQIEQVITSPGIPQLQQAIQALPPAVVPVMNPAASPPIVIAPAATAPAASSPAKPPTAAQVQKVLGSRILQAGLQGSDVLGWQQWLRLDGYPKLAADGKFGPNTTTATKAWQAARGLTADGKVGPATKAAIGRPAVKALPTATAPVKPVTAATRVLQQGLSGADVKAWQEQLKRDGFNVAADGVFGSGTKSATIAWQKQRGLGADGKVGPATRAAIGRPPSAAAPPTAAAAPAPAATIPSGKLTLDSFPDPNPSAPLLQRGSKGDYVKSLQKVLKTFGYDLGKGGPNKDGVDGDFGPTVEKRLKEFQAWALGYYKDERIDVDGKVGPITRRLIRLRAAELLKQAA